MYLLVPSLQAFQMMNVNTPEGCLQCDYLSTCSNVTVRFKEPKEKSWTLCNKLQYNEGEGRAAQAADEFEK